MMRRLIAGLLVLASAAHAQRPFHVADYDLTLTLPEVGKFIEGKAVLTVVRRARADTLVLDLMDLRANKVLLGGKDAPFAQDAEHLRVYVGGAQQDTLRVTIEYSGAVQDGLIVSTGAGGRWMAFGDNWPNRARHWIPSIDHPSDKSTVTWTVIAPSDRKVIANGALVSETPIRADDPDGHAGAAIATTRTKWRESRPIPAYLMVIAAGPLALTDLGNTACGWSESRGCVPQMVYTYPETKPNMPARFAEADSIVTFFSRTFGPFPYEKLAHLQSLTRYGGMENASAIFYNNGPFRAGNDNYGLIAHETGHQWFGDMVTEREWPHLWLSEGFATYLAALYTQHSRGDSAFRAQMASNRTRVLEAREVSERPVIDTIETNLMSLLNRNSYEKGGWVLHMLRDELGDSAFFRGVREYVRTHRHGNALSDDLRASLEAGSKRDLRAFFDQWLRRPGFPEITTSWTYDAASKNVSLAVSQSGRFGFFAFPLAVDVIDASGSVRRTRLNVSAQKESVLPIPAGAAPRSVRIDPDVALLARITAR